MLSIDPNKIATKDLHQYIVSAIAPRPIAFASTIGLDGQPNLAPYSFFNAFSSNPPILIFSSNRRVSNNTTKDTLRNVRETGEVVINVVSHSFVRQMALASIEFDEHVNEFEKSGLTPLASERVKPFRVAESPVQMECVVDKILPLGENGGAGNLIFCNIVMIHIDEAVLSDKGRIDPHKIDLMGRLGRYYYVRASGPAIMEVVQDMTQIGIGFDGLPAGVRHSKVLNGNQLGMLASLPALPERARAQELAGQDDRALQLISSGLPAEILHGYIRDLLENGKVEMAAAVAVLAG